MGSRLHGNDGPAAAHPTIRHGALHNRHSRDGGNPRRGARRWVPVSTGTTGGDGRTPQSSFPRRAEIHGRRRGNPRRGACDGFPSPRERRTGDGALHNRHSRTGGNPRPHNRHSRDGGNPRRGAGDGFPSPRERRTGDGRKSTAPQSHSRNGGRPTQIVIPATAGIHGGGPDGFGDGPAAGAPKSSFPRRAGIHGGAPAMGSRLHGNDGPATGAPHNRHSHNSGNPRPHNRHSRDGGNPRRGAAGDGFPSPRERRAGSGAPHNRHSHNSGNPRPQIVIPATAGGGRTQRAASGNWRPL